MIRELHAGRTFFDDDDVLAPDLTAMDTRPAEVLATLVRVSGVRGLVEPPGGKPGNRCDVRGDTLLVTDLCLVTADGRLLVSDLERLPVTAGGTVWVGRGDAGVAPAGSPVPADAEPLGTFSTGPGPIAFTPTVPLYRPADAVVAAEAWAGVRAAAGSILAGTTRTGDVVMQLARLEECGSDMLAVDAARELRLTLSAAVRAGLPAVAPAKAVETVPTNVFLTLCADVLTLLESEPMRGYLSAPDPTPAPPRKPRWRPRRPSRRLVKITTAFVLAAGVGLVAGLARPRGPVGVAGVVGTASLPLSGAVWPGQLNGVTPRMELADVTTAGRAELMWRLTRPTGEVAADGLLPASDSGRLTAAVRTAVAATGLPVTLELAVGPHPNPVWTPGPTLGATLPGGVEYPVPDKHVPAEDCQDPAGRWVAVGFRAADGAKVGMVLENGRVRAVDQTVVTVRQFCAAFARPEAAEARRQAAARATVFPLELRTFESLAEARERHLVNNPAELAAVLGRPFLHDPKPQPGLEGYWGYTPHPYLQRTHGVVLELPPGATTDPLPVIGVSAYDALAYLTVVRQATGEPRWTLGADDPTWAAVLDAEAAAPGPNANGPVAADAGPGGAFGARWAGGLVGELGQPAADGLATARGRGWDGKPPGRLAATDRPVRAGFRLVLPPN